MPQVPREIAGRRRRMQQLQVRGEGAKEMHALPERPNDVVRRVRRVLLRDLPEEAARADA